MSCKWELNGIALGSGTTPVSVTAHNVSESTRQGREALHGGTEYREKLGNDLSELNITFSITGSGNEKYTIADTIMDVLEDDEVWTLQSPTTTSDHFTYRNQRRIAGSTLTVRQNIVNRGRVDVVATAIVNGVWIADGGPFCETITGNFELESTGPSVYIRDDGENTGAIPLVRLPEQTAGYPLAVKASDFSTAMPTLSASTTIGGRTFEDYDMTGFLIPAPTTAGDVGLYEICSSPTAAFLDESELETLTTEASVTLTTEGGDALVAKV